MSACRYSVTAHTRTVSTWETTPVTRVRRTWSSSAATPTPVCVCYSSSPLTLESCFIQFHCIVISLYYFRKLLVHFNISNISDCNCVHICWIISIWIVYFHIKAFFNMHFPAVFVVIRFDISVSSYCMFTTYLLNYLIILFGVCYNVSSMSS